MKALEPQAAQRYRECGYLILPDHLSEPELRNLQAVCDRLLDEPPDDDKGGQAHNIGRGEDRRFLRHRHVHSPELASFVLGDEMRQLATEFVGETPYLFNEQFVVKGEHTGASFAWHQDSAYVGFEHEPYVSVWIALDDTTVDNGAVYVLEQDLTRGPGIVPHEWNKDGKELVGYQGQDSGIAAIVEAGSMVIFSSLTLHRSSPNVTDARRRAYLAQYSPNPIIDPATNRPKIFAAALTSSAGSRY